MPIIKPKPKTEQPGLVSFLIVAIIVVLLALVTTVFARLMGREVSQALDRELSVQAMYASESGLNDARTWLADDKGDLAGCDPLPQGAGYFVQNGDISGGLNLARYSCVTIQTEPEELIYSLKAGQSLIFKFNAPAMTKLQLGWENQSYSDSGPQPLSSTLGLLPQESSDLKDRTGILRVGLYPLVGAAAIPGADTNNVLNSFSRNYYMYSATSGNNTIDYQTGANGSFVSGKCGDTTLQTKTPRYCNAAITNLSGGLANTYYVRLTAMYAPLSVSVQAMKSNNKPIGIAGVQAIVDVTGTGNDVLRRLQARIDLGYKYNLPDHGVQSMNTICKMFRVPVIGPDNQYGLPYVDGGVGGSCAMPPACIGSYYDTVMTVDASSSMASPFSAGPAGLTKLDAAKEAAKRAVDGLNLSPGRNRAAIVSYDANAQIIQGLSSDTGAVKTAVGAINEGVGTNFGAALDTSGQILNNSPSSKDRVIIFFSDGEPSVGAGESEILAKAAALKASGVIIYTVGIDVDNDILQKMAGGTDSAGNTGFYTEVNNADEFNQILENLVSGFGCNTPPPPPVCVDATADIPISDDSWALWSSDPSHYEKDAPLSTPLKSGCSYKFTVTAWDTSHPTNPLPKQTHEQVFLVGLHNGDPDPVFVTDVTQDIPDSSTSSPPLVFTQVMDKQVDVIKVYHISQYCTPYPSPCDNAQYKTWGYENPNSVHGVTIKISSL